MRAQDISLPKTRDTASSNRYSYEQYSFDENKGTFDSQYCKTGLEDKIKTSEDVYAHDRPLPRDKRTKEPTSETDAPHTQLGTRESKRTGEKYPQAREFDKNGNPVRDIDFTDHGRPHEHPNPHQNVYKPNATGGSLERSTKAEPIEGWTY